MSTPQPEAPSISKVFPYSTVAIIAILVVFKYERVDEMMQVAADYFEMDKNKAIMLILAVVGVLMLLAQGIWMGVYYVRNQHIAKQAAAELYEKERSALVAIFNALEGKNWKDKTRWCSDEPYERWKGVKIDHQTGRVNKLLLAENGLAGFIPEEIGDLESLKEVDFRLNKIKGTLPASLLKLKCLEGLYLFDNFIEGKIPHELSKLPHLTGIYLYNNSFEEVAQARKVFTENVQEGCIVFV